MKREVPEIRFTDIRTSDGSQRGGFEELCFQLFNAEFATVGEVSRVEGKGGDEGYEAVCRCKDGTITGLQAKFFEELRTTQWRQIEKSIRAARAAEPRLREYVVCVPLNLNPSQRRFWQKLQKRHGKRLKLIWWGESLLRTMLTRQEHSARLRYWFGCRNFTAEWLASVNARARADLDCRYTPERHITTDAERMLRGFVLSKEFLIELNERSRSLASNSPAFSPPKMGACRREKNLKALCESANQSWANLRQRIHFGPTHPRLADLEAECSKVVTALSELWTQAHELDIQGRPATGELVRDTPFSLLVRDAGRLRQDVERFRKFLRHYRSADFQKLVLLGEAGSGKSHLLARIVESATTSGQPGILLLGEHFEATGDPWGQLVAQIGWEGTANELLDALQTAAEVCGRPAVICLDAINEAGDRRFWQKHLLSFSQRLQDHPKVRLLVSCRTDFTEISLPKALLGNKNSSWCSTTHQGFGSDTFAAIVSYFDGYKVGSDHFPPILPEFGNPLFLKTVCEAFANARLPAGPLGLELVMRQRIRVLTEKLHRELDFPKDVIPRAIHTVVDLLAAEPSRRAPVSMVRPAVDALCPRGQDSLSLYRHLVSNGLLVEVGPASGGPEPIVRFAFERFAEFFSAEKMLSPFASLSELQRAWKCDGTLKRLSDPQFLWPNSGLLAALWILIAERFQAELSELLNSGKLEDWQAHMFLRSLPWRTAKSFTKKSDGLLNTAFNLLRNDTWDALLRLASIPGHPYNAERLHRALTKMDLPQRDQIWTQAIYQLASEGAEGSAESMLRWAFHAPRDRIPSDQALLVATAIVWMCSTTWRGLRRRATFAAIRLMVGHPRETAALVRRFSGCNDPYVVERVLAVAAGVALRTFEADSLREIAAAVHEAVFRERLIPPNLLQRDYARSVLETATERKCLPDGVTTASFRPPYRSKWPRIWSQQQTQALENQEGWRSIKVSTSLEWIGGDFGIYVIRPKLSYFSRRKLSEPPPPKESRETFDAELGRRWIVQRVHELGWRPERFKSFDATFPPHGRQRVDIEEVKVERFGKKYQRIALHELLGYLSDHYHFGRDHWFQPETFMGAWHLRLRDLDPSLPWQEHAEPLDDDDDHAPQHARKLWAGNPWWVRYPDPFACACLCKSRKDWVVSRDLPDVKPAIRVHPPFDERREWLLLTGSMSWEQPAEGKLGERDPGALDTWVHLKSWLVKATDKRRFISEACKIHFFGEGIENVVADWGWLGEYPWGPAHQSDALSERCSHHHRWLKNIATPVTWVACDWSWDHVSASLPSPQLLEMLQAQWTGEAFKFADASGRLVALSPVEAEQAFNTRGLLVDRKALEDALDRCGLDIVWTVVGERLTRDKARELDGAVAQFSGVYWISRKHLAGRITQHVIKKIYPIRQP